MLCLLLLWTTGKNIVRRRPFSRRASPLTWRRLEDLLEPWWGCHVGGCRDSFVPRWRKNFVKGSMEASSSRKKRQCRNSSESFRSWTCKRRLSGCSSRGSSATHQWSSTTSRRPPLLPTTRYLPFHGVRSVCVHLAGCLKTVLRADSATLAPLACPFFVFGSFCKQGIGRARDSNTLSV